MKKILILTARFGDGHHTAALNVRDAVNLLSDTARVEVVDLLESSFGSLYTLACRTHLKVVQYAPRLWSGLYNLVDHSSLLDRSVAGSGRLTEAMQQILET